MSPEVLLVPLVGFDEAGYRLGYGTGYYDRTLAAPTRPLTVGVGYETARLESIFPQAHDVPMDLIVTERGIRACSTTGRADRHHLPASLAS
jgi:5-formyltetrahydrofolate cyclo-ligase